MWTCFSLNWATVDALFVRLSEMGEREICRHRSTFSEQLDRREENPGVPQRESHLLSQGAAWTHPQRPAGSSHRLHLAGMVRRPPQAQSRTDGRGRREDGGNRNRKRDLERFWDRSGRLFFFFFSNMEMTQCEEEDRTLTQKDGWAGSLSSARSEREEKRGCWMIKPNGS